ncbi:hypothetical protein Ancab_034851 [Ancistrocladus abbreviatus]
MLLSKFPIMIHLFPPTFLCQMGHPSSSSLSHYSTLSTLSLFYTQLSLMLIFFSEPFFSMTKMDTNFHQFGFFILLLTLPRSSSYECPYPCLPPPLAPSLPAPTSLPPPITTTSNCPPPPSPPPLTYYQSPPQYYYPPQFVPYYTPPNYLNPYAPPPPDPILPYFPFYFKSPPPPPSYSLAPRLGQLRILLNLCIPLLSSIVLRAWSDVICNAGQPSSQQILLPFSTV